MFNPSKWFLGGATRGEADNPFFLFPSEKFAGNGLCLSKKDREGSREDLRSLLYPDGIGKWLGGHSPYPNAGDFVFRPIKNLADGGSKRWGTTDASMVVVSCLIECASFCQGKTIPGREISTPTILKSACGEGGAKAKKFLIF